MHLNRPAPCSLRNSRLARSAVVQGLLLSAALLAAPGVQAQKQPPTPTEAAQGVRDSRLSDSDRVFMRGVAPLIIRNRQLGELGRKKLRQGETRRFAIQLSREADQSFSELKKLSDELRNTIPMDMSGVADERLRALSGERGDAFQRQYPQLAVEWLKDEQKSLEDALDRSENESVRRWAGRLHEQRSKLLAQAQRLAGESR